MEIIDISWPIDPAMTAYKDKQLVAFEQLKTFERDHVRESVIRLGSHSGTHIDAPSHFMADGMYIDQVPLSTTIGPCRVVDLTKCNDVITQQDLQQHTIEEGSIILFKTRNSMRSSSDPFDYQFISVAADAAAYLAEKKVKAVGIDYLGIERNQPGHETHLQFMRQGITIIEGLRLAHVQEGSYFLWCLPLAVQGLEAAPARAVLVK